MLGKVICPSNLSKIDPYSLPTLPLASVSYGV